MSKQLHRLDPPEAVEQLIFEVRTKVFELWKRLDFEMWTKVEADLFPGLLRKEVWAQDLGEWQRVSVVIYWTTLDAWLGIDQAWIDAQEAEFTAAIGAGNVRLIATGHDTGAHYFKISDYR